jgi:D-glycero-D-manno-heptose 1,7-bisphosphate phosphatase
MAREPATIAFLDRDGTINVKAPEGEYITRAEDVALIPGSAAAIRRLNDAGVRVAVVTNQRGIALGRMHEDDLTQVHERLRSLLRESAGAELDMVIHCPHDVGECRCRKPLPGMLEAAAAALGPIDMDRSLMIGDARVDVEAGRAFGVGGVLLGDGVSDLYAAVNLMLSPAAQSEV